MAAAVTAEAQTAAKKANRCSSSSSNNNNNKKTAAAAAAVATTTAATTATLRCVSLARAVSELYRWFTPFSLLPWTRHNDLRYSPCAELDKPNMRLERNVLNPPLPPQLHLFYHFPILPDRLVGLVVKASDSRAEGPGFESRLRRDFFRGRVIPVT